MKQLPGVMEKTKEYAIRVLNGENIDDVLDGADSFRSEVEKIVQEYTDKKNLQRTAEENEGLPQEPIDVQKRIADDTEKIEQLKNDISKESIEKTYKIGDAVVYDGAKHTVIDVADHPHHKQQTGEILKVYHLENEVGTPIQQGGVRKYVLAADLKPFQ